MLAQSLAKFGVSPGDPGFVFGEAVADEIVAMRSADGAALAQYPYTAPNAGAPGVWVPTPPAFAAALLPGWGSCSHGCSSRARNSGPTRVPI